MRHEIPTTDASQDANKRESIQSPASPLREVNVTGRFRSVGERIARLLLVAFLVSGILLRIGREAMNAYKLIVIALLFLIISSVYNLGPAIKQFVYTILNLPNVDTGHVRDPAVFSVAVRALYLIALVAIVKLLISRKKDE